MIRTGRRRGLPPSIPAGPHYSDLDLDYDDDSEDRWLGDCSATRPSSRPSPPVTGIRCAVRDRGMNVPVR